MKKQNEMFTTMRSIASGFSYVMDLVNSEVEDHHKKVAYLSYRLAEEMQMSEHASSLSIIGGLLHDIGGVLEQGRISLMDLEANAARLADSGANIVSLIPVNAPLSSIVKYSQSPADDLFRMTDGYETCAEWLKAQMDLPEEERRKRIAPMVGQVIHLADVAVLLFDGSEAPLNQVGQVLEKIEAIAKECNHFHPWVMEAFRRLCKHEAVWLDLAYEPDAFLEFIPDDAIITLEKMSMFSEFASVIIDFRSPFTAMHSAGVSASAVELAKLSNMSREECVMMKIAGNLHDIGKLKIPTEILEKPGKLTDEEFNIIKEHPYFSWKILKHIEGMDTIMQWAVYHHEKLNGKGYPFHYSADEICTGARILAVADIFSALTEDRPYRAGMEKEEALKILYEDAARGDIDQSIVDLLAEHYEQVNEARAQASKNAGKRYHSAGGRSR